MDLDALPIISNGDPVQPSIVVESVKIVKSENNQRKKETQKLMSSNRHIPVNNKKIKPVKFRSFLRNTIFDVLKNRGYKHTEGETDWDFIWADVQWMKEHFDHLHLEEHQRVNHFRNFYELTRKDLLIKNLKRMRKQLEKEDKKEDGKRYDFFPLTFTVPHEYGLLAEEFKKNPGVYIMKPIGKSQGKGIFLFNKLSQIAEWRKDNRWKADSPQAETYVCQKYIDNPYNVGGKKFDIRIYCLVASYTPLIVYLHRNGFARFTFHRYSMNTKDIDNTFVHLTNVAIQKTHENYDEKGCKWSLRQLRLYFTSKHGREETDKCFSHIQEIVVRSLLAVQKTIIQDKHCFELYGYDILIDENLRPWLLEVNASPSLTADTKEDYTLKHDMLDDMMTVVDMEKRMIGNEEQIGGFDLIYKSTQIGAKQPPLHPQSIEVGVPSSLGTYYDREKQLRKLLRPKKK